MANIRSAEKQHRQAEKAKVRNRAGVSHLRSSLKKARTAIARTFQVPPDSAAAYLLTGQLLNRLELEDPARAE